MEEIKKKPDHPYDCCSCMDHMLCIMAALRQGHSGNRSLAFIRSVSDPALDQQPKIENAKARQSKKLKPGNHKVSADSMITHFPQKIKRGITPF